MESALIKAHDAVACVGLFLLEEVFSCAPHANPPGLSLRLDEGGLQRPDDQLPLVAKKALRCFSMNFAHVHAGLLWKFIATGYRKHPEHFQETYHWVSKGLERLALVLKQKEILLQPRTTRRFTHGRGDDDCETVLTLAGSMPAQHLGYWLMLTTGEDTDILEAIDESYKTSFELIFMATLGGLTNICYGIDSCLNNNYYYMGGSKDDDVDQELVESCRQTERKRRGQQVLRSIHLIQKLLDLGLNPNAKVSDYKTSNRYDTCTHTYVCDTDTTLWAEYLVWIDQNRSFCSTHASSREICAQVITIGERFLQHGADHDLRLSTDFRQRYFTDLERGTEERRYITVVIVVERSAYRILETFCLETACTRHQLSEDLLQGGAVSRYSIKEIQKNPDSLRLFSDPYIL